MSKKIGGGRSETLYQHRILPTSDNLIQAALSRFRHGGNGRGGKLWLVFLLRVSSVKLWAVHIMHVKIS